MFSLPFVEKTTNQVAKIMQWYPITIIPSLKWKMPQLPYRYMKLKNENIKETVTESRLEEITLGTPNSIVKARLGNVSRKSNSTENNHDIKLDINDECAKVEPKQPINLTIVNTYDLFKLLSTLTMFVDHYAHFQLPGLPTWDYYMWFRIIGRTAAPGFFFLCGWSSKQFRFRTWFAALFLFIFTSAVPLHIVYSPWESIMNIVLMNCLLYYLPIEKVYNPLVHFGLFAFLQYYQQWASSDMNIGYGTIPAMLSIAGHLARNGNKWRVFWICATMTSFAMSSVKVFANTQNHTIAIWAECGLNAMFMLLFKVIPINMCNTWKFKWCNETIKAISRNGLTVYIGHLMLFKLIAQNNSYY
jgi:hypothetical protein